MEGRRPRGWADVGLRAAVGCIRAPRGLQWQTVVTGVAWSLMSAGGCEWAVVMAGRSGSASEEETRVGC